MIVRVEFAKTTDRRCAMTHGMFVLMVRVGVRVRVRVGVLFGQEQTWGLELGWLGSWSSSGSGG